MSLTTHSPPFAHVTLAQAALLNVRLRAEKVEIRINEVTEEENSLTKLAVVSAVRSWAGASSEVLHNGTATIVLTRIGKTRIDDGDDRLRAWTDHTGAEWQWRRGGDQCFAVATGEWK